MDFCELILYTLMAFKVMQTLGRVLRCSRIPLDLLEAIVDSLVAMSVNFTRRCNRDTVYFCLIKSIDFEFILHLVLLKKY